MFEEDSLNGGDLSVDGSSSTVDYCEINEVEDFINDKYYDIVITDYMKKKVLDDLKETIKPDAKVAEENKRFIRNLQKEVDFLRGDSEAKNRIIELLIKTKRNCRNCKSDSNSAESHQDIEQDDQLLNHSHDTSHHESVSSNNNLPHNANSCTEISNRNDRVNDFTNSNSNSGVLSLVNDLTNDTISNGGDTFRKTTDDMKRYIISYFLQNSDMVDIRFRQTQVNNKESELVVDLKEIDNDNDNDSGTYNDYDYGTISCVYSCSHHDQIEEERLRLMELKRQAAEKAEVEWIEKKKEEEKRELEEKEIEIKKEELVRLKREQELKAEMERKLLQEETEKMKKHEDLLKQREAELAELHKERARREELEELLETKKLQQNILDQTLNQEKEKLSTLERNFAEERSRRLEIEKRLQVEESRNRNLDSDSNVKTEKKPHDSRSVGNGVSSNGTLKRKTPSYNLSLRSGQSSGNAEETNLLHHILALGHVVDHCPEVKINRYSCRGYLQKMGKSRLKISWKRRWFVFDRKLRALCYYQDERKTKSKGILYFQSIQEVYVDSTVKRSPNPKTTFCIRTPTRPYVLAAPSAIAMSIWIDVVCTGKEGVFISMGL